MKSYKLFKRILEEFKKDVPKSKVIETTVENFMWLLQELLKIAVFCDVVLNEV